MSFLFLLISLHFFYSCMSCLVSYYHLLAEKALACKILYAQGDIIRFGNLMKKWTTKEFQSRDKRIIDTCIFKARKSTYLLICIPLFLTEKELFWKILFDKKNYFLWKKVVGPRPGWPPLPRPLPLLNVCQYLLVVSLWNTLNCHYQLATYVENVYFGI